MGAEEESRKMEAELKAFGEYCRKAGFGNREMAEICDPLTACAKRAHLKIRLRAAIALGLFACIVYWAIGVESLGWHASAVGRILIARILPVWDWRFLFRERCLLRASSDPLPKDSQTRLTLSDCASCEAAGSVPHISNANYDIILDRHLIKGTPVIVTDANLEWAHSKNPDLNLTRVLSEDERLLDSVPCVLETNLRTGRQPVDLDGLLNKIYRHQIPNWFVHFQNCDLRAVKSLRTLAPRPYFLSPHVPPAHFNWLLMSDKYSSPRYKPLELDPGLIIVSQLKGGNQVRLKARGLCESLCPKLTFDIKQGETLVLANSLWNFEYSPTDSSQNVAVITETAWNEA